MEILLGCGHDRKKVLSVSDRGWVDLCTVDINPEVCPDKVWDMNNVPLPFPDSSADEIHAYNVLEHTGAQGDYLFMFRQFEDFWRILKPGGFLCASVPAWNDVWTFGDPGHTRVINEGTVTFFDQESYKECGSTARTDYRNIYKGNLKIVYLVKTETGSMNFVLQAVK